ncbi:SDR family NAD(P)-dependent oxidoreductase [Inquilinus sp. OTU3971]|uniref:SDR family NAD(P)-dependent oxidoreductase n=1 Tax=Inquilinus sp. OTU3971 TaxID=3043855 RepID=UPI00313B3409
MEIKDRVVIVCGAASGLDRATAVRLAREGGRLALVDLNVQALEAVAAETGGLPFTCDVADAAVPSVSWPGFSSDWEGRAFWSTVLGSRRVPASWGGMGRLRSPNSNGWSV